MTRLLSTLANHLVSLAAWSVHRATLALKVGHRSRGWGWLGASDLLFAGSELARYGALRCHGYSRVHAVEIQQRAFVIAARGGP